MSARKHMTKRTTVERDMAVGSDDWGDSPEPDWVPHIRELPCATWFATSREQIDGQKTASVQVRKVMAPLGTDVKPADQLTNIRDRRGREVIPGPLKIEAVGIRSDHLILTIEAVS